MKPLSEMTHYEILEVEPHASPDDVERAYRVASATYGDDSLATYSLYEENEVSAIRERIEQAYRVLASNEARGDYDDSLGDRPPAEAGRVELKLDFETVSDVPRAALAPDIEEFADPEDPHGGNFDGARLRRTRLDRGIEVAQIAQITKISPTYLRHIEEERFADLPAEVYVRGFVTAYAQCVGIDPERVVPAYMDRLRTGRNGSAGTARAKGLRA